MNQGKQQTLHETTKKDETRAVTETPRPKRSERPIHRHIWRLFFKPQF